MTIESRLPDRATLAAFLILVVLIGSNVVAIRLGAQELDPFWGAGARFTLAAGLFVALLVIRRIPLPGGRALIGAVLYGLLGIASYFALVYLGLEDVKAGYAAVILASTPLATLFLAAGEGLERFHWRGVVGGAVAVFGVVVVFQQQITNDVPVLSTALIALAAVCAAQAGIFVKLFGPVAPIALNVVAMSVAAPFLVAMSIIGHETQALPVEAKTWLSFAYLTTFGTVGVFGLAIFVLTRWTASSASYQFVLAPLVSVPLAALLLNESITALFALGAVLILTGVYVGAIAPSFAVNRRSQKPALER